MPSKTVANKSLPVPANTGMEEVKVPENQSGQVLDIKLRRQDRAIQLMRTELEEWKKAAYNWKMRHDREHQRYIALSGIIEEKENEIQGLIRRRNVDASKMALEEELSDYAAHNDIQNVVKSKTGWNFKVTMEVVFLIVSSLLIFETAFNPEFRFFIEQNSMLIAVVAVALVVMFLVFYNVGYKKSKK